jgi:hypothetical protein
VKKEISGIEKWLIDYYIQVIIKRGKKAISRPLRYD